MNITEVRRTRNLLIRLDRGEEIPVVLMRALGDAEARSAWITGAGTVEAAEIVVYDQASRDFSKTRRIDTPCALVALSGNAALADGALSLRLSVTLARETDVGLELCAGQLVWARAFSLELYVVAFDDVALLREPDERTGLAVLTAQKATLSPLAEPPKASSYAEPARASASVSRAAEPPAAAQYPPPTAAAEAPVVPQRPARREDDVEVYPDVGDAVEHFHFGDCTVISSDGDRIRLRQDRDGRVREVALSMLRIENPVVIDGKNYFKLSRKN